MLPSEKYSFPRPEREGDYKVLGNLFWNVINTSKYAIILMNNLRIVHCNKKACEMFMAKEEDLIGKRLPEFSPEFQSNGLLSAAEGDAVYQRVLSEGSVEFEWTHKRLNGELFQASVSVSLFESDGSHYVSIILRDITQQIREHTELAEYRHQLESKVQESTFQLEKKNEELVAANSRLSTLNTELNKVIAQHQETQQELEKKSADLNNLLAKNKEQLTELSARFSEVYEYSSDAITFIDIEEGQKLKVFDMNPVARRLFKVDRRFTNKVIYAEDIISEEKLGNFREKLLPAILSGTSVSFTSESNAGKGFWNSRIYPIKNEEGKICRIAAFSRNVTAEFEKERFASILNSAVESWPYELWVTDKEGRCIIQNKQSETIMGNVIGKTVNELKLPEEVKELSIVNSKRALAGEFVSYESLYIIPEGIRNVLVNLQPIKNRNEIWGILGINIDITERKKDEEKLKTSEEQYRLLAENINDVIWKMDAGTLRYTYMSPSIYKLTGHTVEEAVNLTINDYLTPESQKRLYVELPQCMELFKKGGPQFYNFEYELRHKQGHTIWVEINTTFVTDVPGEIKEIVATSRDITERRKMIEALRESEERYRLINKLSGAVVYDYNINDNAILWTGATEEVLGFTIDELNASDLNTLQANIHPDDRAILTSTSDELDRAYSSSQFRCLNKEGKYIWVESQAFLLKDSNGKPYRWLGVMKDITEQYTSKEQIIQRELKFRTIFNATKDGIVLLDKQHHIIDLNFSALKKLGYTREEVIGKKSYQIMMSDKITDIDKNIGSWDQFTNLDDFETIIIAKDKTQIPVELSISKANLGNEDFSLVIIRDIAERKRLENELLNSVINTEEKERLHFSQELHDGIGPLISAAKIYVDWLDKPNANIKKEAIVPDIKKLLEEATRSIRDISFKLSPHILQNYGIVEAIKAYTEKAKVLANIEINFTYNVIPRFEETFETVIYRVVCECINNTLRHAKASSITIDMRYVNNRLEAHYTDNGIGFDIQEITEARKGIGLLNMKSRIKMINGTIIFKSKPGKGTRIELVAER